MIRIKVSEYLGRMKWSQKELAQRTGIRAATINAYYYETVKHITVEHLEALCDAFECQPGDLLEHIKNAEKPRD